MQVPELGEPPDDEAVPQHAAGREHLGMEHCRNLADGPPAGPVKDLFGYLANEETKHKADLEQVHYETVQLGRGLAGEPPLAQP